MCCQWADNSCCVMMCSLAEPAEIYQAMLHCHNMSMLCEIEDIMHTRLSRCASVVPLFYAQRGINRFTLLPRGAAQNHQTIALYDYKRVRRDFAVLAVLVAWHVLVGTTKTRLVW